MNSNKTNPKQVFDISWIQKDTRCWVYQPNENDGDIYIRGVIKGIIPLSINKANSKVSGMLQTGTPFETRAIQIEKCRDSNSLERDLIEMDIINAPEVLRQLKRRLAERKIHTLMWNSLIIVNPFKLIPEQYGQKVLSSYYEHIFIRKEDMRKHQPHIYSFMNHILTQIPDTPKTQVISISGQSGSGKTEANKEALKAITFCCSKMQRKDKLAPNSAESRILKCDPILQVFGNAKTIKNDNSSRFGKMITLRLQAKSFRICYSSLKNYFLEKSRVVVQSLNERNFHIFYQILAYLPEDQRSALRLKSGGRMLRFDDFKYLTNRNSVGMNEDKKMWDELNIALVSLGFSNELIFQIWSIVAATLLLGNLSFEPNGENDPCDIKNPEVSESIAFLLGLSQKQLVQALTTHKRTVVNQVLISPLNQRNCIEGKDSVAKAMYESLFSWLVGELNTRMNAFSVEQGETKIVKLLDIYGFEVFDHNSFEQLCVNYTNEKIHQIYLQNIFIHEKSTLKKEGLQSVIQKLSFTDNIKIIELIEQHNRSVFNLLDESCSVNVKDDDFLASIRKHHDQHEHFPPSNLVNTRKSFIIKHTPGDIEYMAEGFRDKNKDFIREDLLGRLTSIKIKFMGNAFRQKLELLKQEGNKKFLGLKIRKQVKELISEMSTNTDLHFIRCIKPNQRREAFAFIDRVCYNQIRYLGILDTIQMRKDTYHVRSLYSQFYQKYGILQNKLSLLIALSEGKIPALQCKQIVMRFVNDQLVRYDLDYQFGRQRIFLKMSTQNRLDALLRKKLTAIEWASTRLKAQYRFKKMAKERKLLKDKVPKLQRAIKGYMIRLKVLKRKLAVRKIQNAWLKYHSVYFARKKLPMVKVLQKYIKQRLSKKQMANKMQAIKRGHLLLKNLAQASLLSKQVQNYKNVKSFVISDIFDEFWNYLEGHYIDNIVKYLKGGACILANERQIRRAGQATNYRLNIRYRRTLEQYLRGFESRVRLEVKLKSIVKIQNFFRMKKRRRLYLSLRAHVVKIQRNWRKYHSDKMFNLKYVERFFEQGPGGQMKRERSYWRELLHRNILDKSNVKGVEKLLMSNERIKMDKINLFYYLVDFDILTNLDQIYPNNSWIDNYSSLFQQSWQKGNPIQMVDVSDTETIVSTLNKVYTWGNIHFPDFQAKSPTFQKWKHINVLQPPAGKLHKIHAHNRFSVVEVQGQDPFVVGEQRFYHQDCSSKEWKTLNESYIIINGAVLTLKKVEFSRMPINQKIVQLSCGMAHCIAKTSLRKVFVWGDNSRGQLGVGHFKRILKPKLLQYFPKHAIVVNQIAASAYGSLVLQSNGRILWWGTNGTIADVCTPIELYLFEKSAFIDNSHKYGVVRLIPSWSKSLSIIGVTVAMHQGIFKSSQNQIKKKTYQNLISKWNEDILTVMPPYLQTVSGYFQEKLMPKPKIEAYSKGFRQLQHQRIRERLLSQIVLMEQAERALLKQRKKF